MTDYVPSPGEVLEQQREEIETAETEAAAYEAIDPVLVVCALFDGLPEYDALPPGGDIPDVLAQMTPLTADEIHNRLEHHKYEIYRMEEELDDEYSDFETSTEVHERGDIVVVVDDIEFDDSEALREVFIGHRSQGDPRQQFALSEKGARDLHTLLGEVLVEGDREG